MKGLIARVIEADASYFLRNDFITGETWERVMSWLEGNEDDEIQLEIAGWLESDAEYFRKLARALIRHHWYIAPLMAVMVHFVSRRLSRYARRLRDGC